MRLAVGTLREAKLEAVRRALRRLEGVWPPGGEAVELVPVGVPSGVPEMPRSEAEGLAGARNRARAALEATGADLALGLEGGVVPVSLARIAHQLPTAGEAVPASVASSPATPPATCLEHAPAVSRSKTHTDRHLHALATEVGERAGLERPVVLLRNWAAAWDGRRMAAGCGPGIELPRELARAVMGGEELGDAIDRYAGGHDIRSGRGTFGVLTGDVIDRADAFASAILAALAPWYRS